MLELLHFVSIVKKQPEYKAKPNVYELKKHYPFQNIKDKDFVEIATLLEMLDKDVIRHTRDFGPAMAKPFRDAIKATLTAFLNGDTSMITDLRHYHPSWAQQAASASVCDAQAVANNIANGGAKAASSAPVQQPCREVQAQHASPMQVFFYVRA
jgi:hypothetical protein